MVYTTLLNYSKIYNTYLFFQPSDVYSEESEDDSDYSEYSEDSESEGKM